MASTRRPGVAPPRLCAQQDQATCVEDFRPAQTGSTRRSSVAPTRWKVRDTSMDEVRAAEGDGTPQEEEETDPTPIKEEQTTPIRIPDPPLP